jgi:hypothetical protein
MKTPEQLLQELDDRFEILKENRAINIDDLNNRLKFDMKPINICKIEYQKEFEHDEFLNMAIGRVEMLGRCVGIFFLKLDK